MVIDTTFLLHENGGEGHLHELLDHLLLIRLRIDHVRPPVRPRVGLTQYLCFIFFYFFLCSFFLQKNVVEIQFHVFHYLV